MANRRYLVSDASTYFILLRRQSLLRTGSQAHPVKPAAVEVARIFSPYKSLLHPVSMLQILRPAPNRQTIASPPGFHTQDDPLGFGSPSLLSAECTRLLAPPELESRSFTCGIKATRIHLRVGTFRT
jgi:hypothetical protein